MTEKEKKEYIQANSVTERGPLNYKDLQRINELQQEGIDPSTVTPSDFVRMSRYRARNAGMSFNTQLAPEDYQTQASIDSNGKNYLGKSQYDEGELLSGNVTSNQLQDLRHDRQSNTDVLANSFAKMASRTFTTAANNFATIYGIGSAVAHGDLSYVWNNEFSKALEDIDEYMEDNFTNYRSVAQQNASWYDVSNWGLSGFGDNFISNMGFTIGANIGMSALSGAAGALKGATTAALRGSKLAQTAQKVEVVNNIINAANNINLGRKTATAVSLFVNAGNEGGKEAIGQYRNFIETESERFLQGLEEDKQIAAKNFTAERAAIMAEYEKNRGSLTQDMETGRLFDPAAVERDRKLQALNEKYKDYTKEGLERKKQAGLAEIEERAKKVGNRTFVANFPVLLASDAFMWARGLGKSYDNGTRISFMNNKNLGADMVKTNKGAIESIKDNLSRRAKKEGIQAVEATKVSKSLLNNSAFQFAKPFLSEGVWEEGLQGVASEAAYKWQASEDIDDYWKSKLDPESARKTGSYLGALSQAFGDAYLTLNGWEEMVVGGISGMIGAYMPTKLFNQDKTKSRLNPLRYGSWEGGLSEFMEWRDKKNNAQQLSQELNSAVSSQDFYDLITNASQILSDLSAAKAHEEAGQNAAADGNKKKYKDEDAKALAHYFNIFHRSGRMNEFTEIMKSAWGGMTDEQINTLVDELAPVKTKQQAYEEALNNRASTTSELQQSIMDADREYDDLVRQRLAVSNRIRSTQGLKKTRKMRQKAANILNQKKINDLNKKIKDIEAKRQEAADKLNKLSSTQINIDDFHDVYEDSRGWVDSNGNRLKSNDEIRKEIDHNTISTLEELKKFQESADYVQKRTNGLLSNDQDDHLTYLAYLCENKKSRVNSIFERLQGRLPSQFKLHVTPEEKQRIMNHPMWRDRAVEDTTNKGLLLIDTKGMNNKEYQTVFLQTFFSNKENQKELTAQLVQNDLMEQMQAAMNSGRVESYISEISDAVNLYAESLEFEHTLENYLNNPELATTNKQDNAVKASTKATNQALKNKSVRDIVDDHKKGKANITELLKDSNLDEDVKNKLQQAKALIDKEDSLLDAASKLNVEEEDKKAVQEMIRLGMSASESVEEYENGGKNAWQELAETLKPSLDKATVDAIENDPNLTPEQKEAAIERLVQEKLDELQKYQAEAERIAQEEADKLANLVNDDLIRQQAEAEAGGESNPNANARNAQPALNPLVINGGAAVNEEMQPATPIMSAPALEEQEKATVQHREEITLGNGSVKSYWKSNTTEVGIYNKIGDNTPWHENPKDTKADLHSKIHKFLLNIGAFARRNSGEIKQGTALKLGFSQTLNKETGTPIPLLLAKDTTGVWQVVGDMISVAENNTDSFKSLPNWETYLNQITQQYNEKVANGATDDVVICDGPELIVRKMLIGRPMYSSKDQRHTLNEIFKDVPFKIGVKVPRVDKPIMVDSRKVTAPATALEESVKEPLKAENGQPFVLVKTSSGYMTVPFTMPRFNLNDDRIKNSKLGQQAIVLINRLSNIATLSDKELFELKKELVDMFVFDGLYLSKDEKTGTITVGYKIAGMDKSESIQFTPDIYSSIGNYIQTIMLPKINGNLPFQIDVYKIHKEEYLNAIGELAETNLEIGGTHTRNDFPVFDFVGAGGKPVEALAPATTGINPNATTATGAGEVTLHTNPSTPNKKAVKTNADGSVVYYDISTNKFVLGDGNEAPLDALEKSKLWCEFNGVTVPTMTEWCPEGKHYSPKSNRFIVYDRNKIDRANAFIAALTAAQSKVTRPTESNNVYGIDSKTHERVHTVMPLNSRTEPNEKGRLNGERAKRVGTEIDSIVRQFFDPSSTDIIYDKSSVSPECYNALITYLKWLRNEFASKGETVYANNLVVASEINGVKVAGEIDILTIDEEGNVRIYDMKTSKNGFTHEEYETIKPWQNYPTKQEHTIQLNFYADMIEKEYGIKVSDLNIIPMVVKFVGDAVAGTRDPAINLTGLQLIPLGRDSSLVTNAVDAYSKDKKPQPTQPILNDFNREQAIKELANSSNFVDFANAAEVLNKLSNEQITKLSKLKMVGPNKNKVVRLITQFGTLDETTTQQKFIELFGNKIEINASESNQIDNVPTANTIHSIDVAEKLFNESNPDAAQKELAKKVFEVAKKLGITISFGHQFEDKTIGGIQYGKHIQIAAISTTKTLQNNGTLATVLLHEVIHGVTEYALDAYDEGILTDSKMVGAVETLKAAYEVLKEEKSLAHEYGITNVKEMVAETARPSFRDKLKNLNLWQSIKQAIKQFFNTITGNSAYDVINTALEDLLDNYDLALFKQQTEGKEKNISDLDSNKVILRNFEMLDASTPISTIEALIKRVLSTDMFTDRFTYAEERRNGNLDNTNPNVFMLNKNAAFKALLPPVLQSSIYLYKNRDLLKKDEAAKVAITTQRIKDLATQMHNILEALDRKKSLEQIMSKPRDLDNPQNPYDEASKLQKRVKIELTAWDRLPSDFVTDWINRGLSVDEWNKLPPDVRLQELKCFI